jgi:glycosyltransferase involved in cell wall biosynthesis
MVNTSDSGGGAQEMAATLIGHMRGTGHEVTLAVGHSTGDDPGVVVLPNAQRRGPVARAGATAGGLVAMRGARGLGRTIEHATQPRRWLRAQRGDEDFDFPGTWALLERDPPPDVIHAHNLHGGYFDLRALPALSRFAPTLLTLHDGWLLSGHCAHSFDCDRWTAGCGGCPYLNVYPATPRDRTAHNWRRKRAIYTGAEVEVATPSRWLADRVQRSMLADAATAVHVIPNGVDTTVFSPASRDTARHLVGLPQDADVILFAANSTASNDFKDFPTLMAALERLGAVERARPLVLACVGEAGPQRRVGSAQLRMIGHLGRPEALVPWYRAADVYAHAARADTFPTTVLEALACGVPVAATAVGGIPEQVIEGETGLLTAPGDPAALAAAIERLLEDPMRRTSMRAAARADAERRFDARRMAEDYARLYVDLTERKRPEARRSSSISDSSRMRTS